MSSFLWRRSNNNIINNTHAKEEGVVDVQIHRHEEELQNLDFSGSMLLSRKNKNNNNNKNDNNSSSITATAVSSPMKPLLDWSVAHRQTCWQNQILAASPVRVAQTVAATHRVLANPHLRMEEWIILWNSNNNSHEDDSDCILHQFQQELWPKLDKLQRSATSILPMLNSRNPQQQQADSSSSSSYWSTPRKILSVVASPITLAASLASRYLEEPSDYDHVVVAAPPPPLENTPPKQKRSTKEEEEENVGSTLIPPNAIVIHVPFVAECLDYLHTLLQRQPPPQQAHMGAILIPSLPQWILQQASNNNNNNEKDKDMAQFLAHLPASHLELLVQCLMHQHQQQKIRSNTVTLQKVPNRANLYALVLGSQALDPNTNNNNNTALEVALTLHDLQCHRETQQTQLQQYRDQAAHAAQQARQAQRQGQPSWRFHMQRRQLLLKHVAQQEQILLNLEMTQQAVEAAVHQTSTLRALQSAAAVFKSLRTNRDDTTITDDATSIMDDLAEEMEHWRVVSEENAVAWQEPVDEDELLQELEALTAQDEEEASPAANHISSASSTTSTTVSAVTAAPEPILPLAPLSNAETTAKTTTTAVESGSLPSDDNNKIDTNENDSCSPTSGDSARPKILVGSSPY